MLECKPHLIGIAGPSGAGKTELARALSHSLRADIISLDSYYRDLSQVCWHERVLRNFDDPAALDSDLLIDHIRKLVSGEGIQKPIYNFSEHVRTSETELVHPSEFVIVEGLFTLHWAELRSLLRTKVYVTLDDEQCYQRRLLRDVRERGRSVESVQQQYRTTVRPMALRYIYPTREFADVTVSGNDPIDQTSAAVLLHIRGLTMAAGAV